MATVVLFDPQAELPLQVQWALWFARARRAAVTLLLPSSKVTGFDAVEAQVRQLVLADGAFVIGAADDADDAQVGNGAAERTAAADDKLRCRLVPTDLTDAPALLAAASAALPNLFVVMLGQLDAKDERAARIGEQILPKISCAVAVVRLGGGTAWPLRHLLVPASRGPHPRAALQLAQQLVSVIDGRLTGAYVEPDIGSDAPSVGRHVIDRVLNSALEDGPRSAVSRRVVVLANVETGLVQACEQAKPDAVVIGMPRPGLLGPRFHGTLPARLCRRLGDVPVVVLRRALPLGNRLRRGIEALLQRFVPQVERATRVELAARVQSSSAWNFDFVALISLSTVIAALGLLQNSAAVIIGAMLIAPLMTPILGLGLAMAQGNAMLAMLALRAIAYGVGTSFLLAAVVGWLDGCSHHPTAATAEMLARGWPGSIDLGIAFVSGLAAAYAHSRPGLIAALPGVAIAAALVPPIATSGIAFAAGDFQLAYGSFLLFVSNMVAIVLAAGLSLWAVGVRRQREHPWLRRIGNGLVVGALVLAVYLTQRTHPSGRVALPPAVAVAIADALPDGLRLVGLQATQAENSVAIAVHLGGADVPERELAGQLFAVVDALLDEPVQVRVAYVWEAFAGGDREPDGK